MNNMKFLKRVICIFGLLLPLFLSGQNKKEKVIVLHPNGKVGAEYTEINGMIGVLPIVWTVN